MIGFAGARDGDVPSGEVLVKTDGSSNTGVTAGQGTLMPASVVVPEVAGKPKSHPRVAMWCGACSSLSRSSILVALLDTLHAEGPVQCQR